jgi:hypothetical protein
MPPGAQRTNELKKAGLLRRVADSQRLIFAKKGQAPEVNEFKEFVSCRRSVRPAQSPARGPLIALSR